ncbi:MAG TPA: hypothetical protein VN843_35455 [Anaerolineales bacterium]|nr:hypothetical protein [Anaerolineales bacterium]
MTKTLLISLCIALVASSRCGGGNGEIKPPTPPKKKGIVAIVYSDLTKSIDENIANRQKENIGELFKRLPVNTKFFLYSIDRATNKPDIYKFTPPTFIKIRVESDRDRLKKQIEDTQTNKETTEFDNLNRSLNSYYSSITNQKGPVSCIANKLTTLLDTIGNKNNSFPEHELRLFFYSDMIEQCQSSFDGKPANLEKHANDKEEAKYLQDLQQRIEQNFGQAAPDKNLKSMGTKVYIVLTSQDDKQNLNTLKTIWNAFFKRLGLDPEDLVWANGNEEVFWEAGQVESL